MPWCWGQGSWRKRSWVEISLVQSLDPSVLFWSLFLHSPASPLITHRESSRESTWKCFLELGNV